jgi:hypothetical protein
MKLGIIQTRGLGDIVIAAPIAMYYISRGCEVYWPIDSDFIPSFSCAFPKIKFIPIDKSTTGCSTINYFYNAPLEELKRLNCDSIICLYSHLGDFDLGQRKLQASFNFDAYKYAVAKVPFREKWNFHPKRNLISEAKLFELLDLNPAEKYIIVHEEGSDFKMSICSFLSDKNIRIVQVRPITNNIFDWIGVIENCSQAYMIDSVYANIIEQLNLKIEKTFFTRSQSNFTPTLINQWNIA